MPTQRDVVATIQHHGSQLLLAAPVEVEIADVPMI